MALAFNNTKGKAVKTAHELYKYKDNENTVRLVGGILPRYVYWLKGTNNKDIPVESLAFDRQEEKFNNLEVDHVQEFFKDAKCGWAYCINCIDPADGKVKVLNLKKKLFEQIMTAAEDLGDPTDPVSGWDVVFKKTKTGSSAFNVEYTLAVLRCKPRALTEAELTAVKEAPTIDEKMPRPTAEEVKALLVRLTSHTSEDPETTDSSSIDKEAVQDL